MPMTEEEMQTAISNKMGFDLDYLKDLNAMNEAESKLSLREWWCYCGILRDIVLATRGLDSCIGATAYQRAKAFCCIFWPEKFKE
jgi:hypothetical protein